MDKNIKDKIQSATFERLLKHLDERKDVQNIDLMNLANFCRNCLSRWYREEAEKKGVTISDPDAREHIYGMPTQNGKRNIKNNYFSLSLGNNSTKLHGLWLISN